MLCRSCGREIEVEAKFCNQCGAVVWSAWPAFAPLRPEAEYAGFWLRWLANLIDVILILVVVQLPLAFLAVKVMAVTGIAVGMAEFAAPFGLFVAGTAGAGMWWLYSAYLESSQRQATVGKMVLGLRVTDLKGQRISFGRATGRHFAKYLSGFFLSIGYIMAGFTEKKQALHDMVAGTLVVRGASATR